MTSLDRLPLTTAPDLDHRTFNFFPTPGGGAVSLYYTPSHDLWVAYVDTSNMFIQMPGIDATDWPEVWAEIISKEQAG